MKMLSTTMIATAVVMAGALSLSPETGPNAEQETPMDQEPETPAQEAPLWIHTTIEEVRADRAEHGRPWQEFIRVPDLFTGLYEIPAGGEDRQSPHDADEVYYIIEGRATAVVEGDRVEVGPGSVLYVAKEKEHRFIDITEDLSVLVFFATGERADG